MHTIDFASVDEDKAPGELGFKTAAIHGCVGVQIRAEFDFGTRELEDEDWKRDSGDAIEAGLKAGPYLIVNFLPGGDEPEAHVAKLASIVGTLDPAHHLVPAFDLEFPRGIIGTHHTIPEILALVRRYIQALRDWQNGVWPELYFSGRVWNTTDTDTLGNPPAPDLIDCSPWCAYYPGPTGQPPVFDPPASWEGLGKYGAPNPWGWAAKHQYQGDARPYPGIGQCDISQPIVVGPGSPRGAVLWYQDRLAAFFASCTAKGVTVPPMPALVSGVYDDATKARVKLFQQYSGLVDDGIAGFATHTAANWVPI